MNVISIGRPDTVIRFKGETLWRIDTRTQSRERKTFTIREISAVVGKVMDLTVQDEEILSRDIEADVTVSSWATYTQPGQITTVIVDDDKNAQNAFLDSFCAYKSSCKHCPCLVIIDECHNFDMSQDSTLIKKLLRQGSKYGIALCLMSQFFNSSEVDNITDILPQFATKITFDRTDKALKLLGLSSKDTYVTEGLTSWRDHDFLVSGKIATENCKIDYPLLCNLRGSQS